MMRKYLTIPERILLAAQDLPSPFTVDDICAQLTLKRGPVFSAIKTLGDELGHIEMLGEDASFRVKRYQFTEKGKAIAREEQVALARK